MSPAPTLSTKEALAAMQPDVLLPTLLPFQCRSVAWLLEREGMTVKPSGSIIPSEAANSFTFWQEVQSGNHIWYLNSLSGELVEEKPEMPTIYGGMLAEEPGLGKTLETIALILLNPAPDDWNPSLTRWDPVARFECKAVKASLIVTPPSLVSQWFDELSVHAPTLKVLVYDGWTKLVVPAQKTKYELDRVSKLSSKGKKKKKINPMDFGDNQPKATNDQGELLEWADYVHQFDVVITTYSVLRSEIWVARPGPDRPKREEANYSETGRLRSPLVMVEWKRVVMDEVQMVGGGNAAEMVSYIPRLSSLAVSGTPAKAQMSDLIHVLKFLRIDQLVGNIQLWKRLLKPGYALEFAAFLQHYGIRTPKSAVSNELTIPQQTRYLVPIELGKVEQAVYDQALETVLQELGLDARGVAASSAWQVNGQLLRTSLRRLRGICTHPQVGQLQRKGDGLYKSGTLKTIDAVLQAMRDQNWKNLMEDWKSKIQARIRSVQLMNRDESDKNRYQHALQALLESEADCRKHTDEITDVLAEHDMKGEELKADAAALRQKRGEDSEERESERSEKGKQREYDHDDADPDEDPEEKGLPKTQAGQEHRSKRQALKARLREARLMMHRIKFLQGDTYHVLGKSAEEDAGYQAAELLRRDLLKVTADEAKKSVKMMKANVNKKNLKASSLDIELPVLGKGGIRSAELFEELNTLAEEVLNVQGVLLWKWRGKIVDLLMKPLSQDEQADGEEYQRTLDDQGEAEAYLQAYTALLADRREALHNERTLLAAHEVREKKLRQTKAALKATAVEDDALERPEGLDIHPEHEVLHQELSQERKEILLKLKGRAIKSVLIDLSTVNAKIHPETHPEKILVVDAMRTIRSLMSQHTSLLDTFEGDLALLRKAFNQRVLYFRQLQEISDSVAEVEWEEESVTAALVSCQAEMKEMDGKINTARARRRYLENLAGNKVDDRSDDEDDEQKTCILCRCDFVRGFITHCAHVFCELCMKAWMNKSGGKTCPVCRVAINPDTVQRFTVNPTEAEAPPRPVNGEAAPRSRRKIAYNKIPPSLVNDIGYIETYGSFGTKIQTLIRHILYLKLSDPGAKSIVFSAWADSLHIVEMALRDNGIKSLRIDQKSHGEHATTKFRRDPDILVLLLHGERENAGLNVTCASRVFLLESVVHHSFEIQAIARIDRLGQTRPTEVYCYYAEDTIERNILDLAARKGLSLYTKDNSIGTVSVSSFANDAEQAVDEPTKGTTAQKGDFIYKVDDMLAILFPHMYEELEFLLPPVDELAAREALLEDVEMADSSNHANPLGRRAPQVNAAAGPSRLS